MVTGKKSPVVIYYLLAIHTYYKYIKYILYKSVYIYHVGMALMLEGCSTLLPQQPCWSISVLRADSLPL